MSRLFDPVNLLSQNVEANATKRDPLPIGEGTAQVTKLEFTEGDYKDKKTGEMKTWNRLDITAECTDPDYVKLIGDGTQEKTILFHGIMLDMNGGEIAVGSNKNIKLGQFREACGANGQPLGAMIGNYFRFQMGHKPHPKNEGEIMHEIVGVTKI